MSCLLCTFGVKAWKAFLLIKESMAGMSTWENLVAMILDHVTAFFLEANIIKCCYLILVKFDFFDNVSTESALFGFLPDFELLTGESLVVWIFIAFTAEVLLTEVASHSEVSHVLTGLCAHLISLVIL